MSDEDIQTMNEMNSSELVIDENGDWIWRSCGEDITPGDFEWARFEDAYWNAYPVEVHPGLRERAQLSDTDEVTEVNVVGPDDQRCVTLTLYDRERDTIHFEVVKCTRLERVTWGLEEDPYVCNRWADTEMSRLEGPSLSDAVDLQKPKASAGFQDQWGEEFEEWK